MNYSNIAAFDASTIEYFNRAMTFLVANPDFGSYTVPAPPAPTGQATHMLPVNSTPGYFNHSPFQAPYSAHESYPTIEQFAQPHFRNIHCFDAKPEPVEFKFNPFITPSSMPSTSLSDSQPSQLSVLFSSHGGKHAVPTTPRKTTRPSRPVPYLNFQQRLQRLRSDPCVKGIYAEKNIVRCARCKKYIQLDNRNPRTLHLQNWLTHKRRCLRDSKESKDFKHADYSPQPPRPFLQ